MVPSRGFCLCLCFLLWTLPVQAEYRVFLLRFSKPAAEPGQPDQIRLVESTLDPEQYRLYYPTDPKEQLSYIDTWRCFGRTDYYKPFCPSPRAPAVAPDSTSTQDQISPEP